MFDCFVRSHTYVTTPFLFKIILSHTKFIWWIVCFKLEPIYLVIQWREAFTWPTLDYRQLIVDGWWLTVVSWQLTSSCHSASCCPQFEGCQWLVLQYLHTNGFQLWALLFTVFLPFIGANLVTQIVWKCDELQPGSVGTRQCQVEVKVCLSKDDLP